MITRTTQIRSYCGMHARPATNFLKKIKKLGIPLSIEAKGIVVEGPSIMTILGLCLQKGDVLILRTPPEYADKLDELVQFIENGFEEP